jgi:polysaccharide biosynthesis protein PslJ
MDFWGSLVVLRRHWVTVTAVLLLWLPAATVILWSPAPTYGSSGSIAITSPKSALKWTPNEGYQHPRNPLLNFTSGLPVALAGLIQQLRDPSVVASSPLLADETSSFSVQTGGHLPMGDPNSPILLIQARGTTPRTSQAIVQEVIDTSQRLLAEQQIELGVATAFRVKVTVVLPPTNPVQLKGSRSRGLLAALLLTLPVALGGAVIAERLQYRWRIRARQVPPSGSGPPVQSGPISEPAWPMRPPRRMDVAMMTGAFVVFLTAIPARLVPVGLPASLSLASLVGLLLGGWWMCAHLVHHLGMAKGWNLVRAVILTYALSLLLTYGYATTRYLPFDELHSTDHTIVTMASLIAVALAVCDGVRDAERLHFLLKIVVCGATFMAVVGLIQSVLSFDLTRYLELPGLRPSFDDSLYHNVLERDDLRRPAGTAGHPIEFGAVCAMALPLGLYYALRPHLGFLNRMFWATCAAVTGIGSVLALSRSAMICLAVAAMFLVIGWPLRRTLTAIAVVGVSFLVTGLAAPRLITALVTLFASASSDPSIQTRTQDYDPAFVEAARHPWLGRGLGTWLSTKYNILDNQYLHTLLENGVVGVVAFALLFTVPVVCLLRLWRRLDNRHDREFVLALAAALSVNTIGSITYDSLTYTIATGLTFVLIGATAAALRICREEPDKTLDAELLDLNRPAGRCPDRWVRPGEADEDAILEAEIVGSSSEPHD